MGRPQALGEGSPPPLCNLQSTSPFGFCPRPEAPLSASCCVLSCICKTCLLIPSALSVVTGSLGENVASSIPRVYPQIIQSRRTSKVCHRPAEITQMANDQRPALYQGHGVALKKAEENDGGMDVEFLGNLTDTCEILHEDDRSFSGICRLSPSDTSWS